ncbi:MAG: protein kinase domain-containing protein [Planctomycetota bacterium]
MAILLEALRKTAQKRKLISTLLLDALAEVEAAGSLATAADLHQWLATGGGGIDRRTGRKLAQSLVPPERPPFGTYRPLTHLADGGMGSVWLAADPSRRLVVVKTLRKDLGQSEDLARRFQREARITQDLVHPGAVRSIDAGQATDGTLYMVLEYVDAGDLEDVVEAAEGLDERQSLCVLYQVTDAVEAANAMHLVHRDIKPANIFAAGDGTAKLADFGIARSTESNRTMLTMEGAVIGSPLYMSPEQVLGLNDIDIRCDIYALGAVLWFCLTGRPPYEAKSAQEVMHMHCEAPPPDVHAVLPDAHKLTAQIVRRAMAKQREERYSTPAAMLRDIKKALKKLRVDYRNPLPLPVHLVRDFIIESNDLTQADDGDRSVDEAISLTAATMAMANADGGAQAATRAADPQTEMAAAGTAATIAAPAPGVAPAPADPAATVADPGFGQAVDATMATIAPAAASSPFLQRAFDGDWLTLRSPYAGDGTCVLLYARTRVSLGKLCDAPCDIGLRNYPIQVHRPAVQRVSRQHVVLAYDGARHCSSIEDCGSANGSLLDGRTLAPQEEVPLETDRDHLLLLAGVVSLGLRPLPARRPAPERIADLPPSPNQRCGWDTGLQSDGLLITRPDNRPEMASALVWRRLSIGGAGCDLVLPGMQAEQGIDIALWHGHWCWRILGEDTDFHPLAVPSQIACAGRQLVCAAGDWAHITTDP